jgi:hypothetical protein
MCAHNVWGIAGFVMMKMAVVISWQVRAIWPTCSTWLWWTRKPVAKVSDHTHSFCNQDGKPLWLRMSRAVQT